MARRKCSPIRPPRIQLKTIQNPTFVWHRVVDCSVVEVKGTISLWILQGRIDVSSLEQKDAGQGIKFVWLHEMAR
jgi:hypothetical protein